MSRSYQNFEKMYESILRQAREDDENCNYGLASQEYKRAAQLLLEYAREADGPSRQPLIDTANRLAEAAEHMKKMQKAGARFNKDEEQSDSEKFDFKPVANHPNVHFEDIAGLSEAKQIIQSEIIQPRLHPEAYARFNQDTNGGILLYGLPGTGKTMLAKCIATETKADFFPIRCSDIVSKWFGEAEKRIKGLFDAAHESQNAIIFIDEFESLAAKRGGNSTVMNRLVPELLSQMDGFENHPGRLTIIGATNTPWAIDTAFLRFPRFTFQICVPLPDDEARQYMFNRLFEKMPIASDIDIARLSESTEGFTCADIKSLVNKATRKPIQRSIERNNNTEVLEYSDILSTLQTSRSSIMPEDIARIKAWNNKIALQ